MVVVVVVAGGGGGWESEQEMSVFIDRNDRKYRSVSSLFELPKQGGSGLPLAFFRRCQMIVFIAD